MPTQGNCCTAENLPIISYQADKSNIKTPPYMLCIPWRTPEVTTAPYDGDFKYPASDCQSNQQAAERSSTRMEIGLICACVILTIIPILVRSNTQKQKNSLRTERRSGTEQTVGLNSILVTDGYQQATRNLHESLYGYQCPVYPQVGWLVKTGEQKGKSWADRRLAEEHQQF